MVEEGLHSGPLVVTAVRIINTVCVVKGWSWPSGEDGGGETAVAGEDGWRNSSCCENGNGLWESAISEDGGAKQLEKLFEASNLAKFEVTSDPD